MATARRKSAFIKRPKRLLLLLTLLLLVAGGLYWYFSSTDESKIVKRPDGGIIDMSPATDEARKEAENRKLQQFSSSQSDENPPIASGNQVKISRIYQDSSSGDVIVQTELAGNGWEKCTLKLSQGSQTVIKTAEAIYQRLYSSCLGFSVKKSDFPVGGTWSAVLSASKIGGGDSSSSAQTIEVKK